MNTKTPTDTNAALLREIVRLAQPSGRRIRNLYSSHDRVDDRRSLIDPYHKVEAVSVDGLRESLLQVAPGSAVTGRRSRQSPRYASTSTAHNRPWLVATVEQASPGAAGAGSIGSIHVTVFLA